MVEELGRRVAPVPFLASAVVATAALLAAGDADLLPTLAAGESHRSAGRAVPGRVLRCPRPPWPSAPCVTVTRPACSGSPARYHAGDALPATVLLVPADGVPDALYAVDAGAEGVTRPRRCRLDLTRPLADLTLDGAPGRRSRRATRPPRRSARV